MKTLTFATAVLCAIRRFTSISFDFSAHDITKELRRQVNSGEIALSDIDERDVDGSITQYIEHDVVRNLVRELYTENLIPDYGRKDNGQYIVYTKLNITPSQTTTVTLAAQPTPTPTPTPPQPAISQITKETMVIDYVKRKVAKGEHPTLKRIQSRMKRASLTCGEIESVLMKYGYAVRQTGRYCDSVVV